MLVAEEIAHRTGKELDFKDWDGDDGGKPWARNVRQLLGHKDVDVQIPDGTEEYRLAVEEIIEENAFGPPDESPQPPESLISQPEDYDSDDSLIGYAAPSSRSPSPTLSELAEVEKDPTLRVGKTKIVPPIYLAQLGEMIRGTSGLKTDQQSQEVEKMEVALNVAEELIRRKRGYGTELGKLFMDEVALLCSFYAHATERGKCRQSCLRTGWPP